MHKFLLEIGVEEIPARFLSQAPSIMKEVAERLLESNSLNFSNIKIFVTPRRLAILIEGLPEKQRDTVKEIWGPPAKIAYDEKGAPTKTLIGFCSSYGIRPEDVTIKKRDKGDYVVAIVEEPGLPTKKLLERFSLEFIGSLNFPKSMRWADHSIKFVRPIRWILALFDSEIIKIELDGIRSGNYSSGHRFLSGKRIPINHPDEYIEKLASQFVIVDQEKRRELIIQQINALCAQAGLKIYEDEELIEHVTYLVEFPRAVMGNFSEEYLSLPPELLITVMRDHQKYFATYNEKGLSNSFILISNTSGENDSTVRKGAERVIRARFDDARFYLTEDRNKRLEERVEELKRVVFHEKLGSLYDKTQRIRHIVNHLGKRLMPEILELLDRAALLSKADLVTGVVREFPELQGIMGYYYALYDGESNDIALAIKEQYLPRRSGDKNPSTHTGAILSIADKIDNICSFFSLGLEPTGSEDPFALRRQAIGIIGILRKRKYPVTIEELTNIAANELKDIGIPVERIIDFIIQRLEVILVSEEYSPEIVKALNPYLAKLPVDDLIKRLEALEEFKRSDIYPQFILAAKRVFNMVSKYYNPGATVEEGLFETEHEMRLFKRINEIKQQVEEYVLKQDYPGISKTLCLIIPEINSFFDNVLVMAKDEKIKNNRLNLLSMVWETMLLMADFSACSS